MKGIEKEEENERKLYFFLIFFLFSSFLFIPFPFFLARKKGEKERTRERDDEKWINFKSFRQSLSPCLFPFLFPASLLERERIRKEKVRKKIVFLIINFLSFFFFLSFPSHPATGQGCDRKWETGKIWQLGQYFPFSLTSPYPLPARSSTGGRKRIRKKNPERICWPGTCLPGQILSLDSSSGSGEDEDDRKKKGKLTDGPTFSTFFFVIFTSLTTSREQEGKGYGAPTNFFFFLAPHVPFHFPVPTDRD